MVGWVGVCGNMDAWMDIIFFKDGWLDGYKNMDGRMDRKIRWMVGWKFKNGG